MGRSSASFERNGRSALRERGASRLPGVSPRISAAERVLPIARRRRTDHGGRAFVFLQQRLAKRASEHGLADKDQALHDPRLAKKVVVVRGGPRNPARRPDRNEAACCLGSNPQILKSSNPKISGFLD